MPAPAPRAARSNPIVYLIISNFLVQTRPGTPAWPAAAPRATCSRARARQCARWHETYGSRARGVHRAGPRAPARKLWLRGWGDIGAGGWRWACCGSGGDVAAEGMGEAERGTGVECG